MGVTSETENQQQKSRTRERILELKTDPPPPPIPNVNYASLLLEHFAQFGEKTALVDAKTNRSYTYGDLRRNVLKMHGGLLASGMGRGDAVILMSMNHIDMPIVLLSVILSEGVCVPVNPSLTAEDLVHVIRTSEAKWVVAHTNAIGRIEKAIKLIDVSPIKQLWVLGDKGNASEPSIKELKKQVSTEQRKVSHTFDAATTVALMPFSSGTTGLPKGVMLSHRNLLTIFMRFKYSYSLSKGRSSGAYATTLLPLPIYHIYGHNVMTSTFFSGGRVVILTRFSPKEYFGAIQKFKVTFSPLVPHIMKFLNETPLMKNYDISSLKGFATSSSPISEETLQKLTRRSGKPVRQGFGMTESSGGGSTNGGASGFKANSIGKLMPYYQGKVINVETGNILREGEEGELCLRGPGIMLGYANNPKATAEAINSEGWLHTGDLCYYDEDDFLFITDRIKDIIKVKSFQVSPTELENIIQRVDGVKEVAVAGIPSERFGEVPRAWIVPREGAIVDTEKVIKYVAENVAPYKQLLGGIELVESIPKNHIGKIVRRQLRNSCILSQSKL